MQLKNKGFIFIEAIFSVFVTFMIVLILQGMVQNLKTINKFNRQASELTFSYVQFDRFINEPDAKTYALPEQSSSIKAVICKEKDNKKKTYILSQYQDMIRLTTTEKGHMPLILNVKGSSFEVKDGQLKLNVLEKNQQKSELYFKLAKAPKVKDEKNNKKQNEKISKNKEIKG